MHLIVDSHTLKTSADVMKDIITDVNMKFDSEGLHVLSQDPDKSTILKFRILKGGCIEYEFGNEEPLYIGVNMPHFYKLIRNSSSGSIISLDIDSDTPKILKIGITSPFKTSCISIQSLDLPPVEPIFPVTVYSAVCEVPTATLQRVFRDLSFCSKKIAIGYTKEEPTMLVIATSGEVSTTSISLCPSVDGLRWAYVDGEKHHQQFFGKHIEKFLKPVFSKSITIAFKKDAPILFDYGDYFANAVHLSLHVAPIPST